MPNDNYSKRISDLEIKLATASQNMSELALLPSFELLMDLHRQPGGLIGETKQFASGALDSIDELLKCLNSVTEVINRARKLNCSPVLSSDRREKLEKLLFGKEILLAQYSVPLEQRSLLTPAIANRHVSVDELLVISNDAFSNARGTLVEFERIVAPFQERLRQTRPVIEDLVRRQPGAKAKELLGELNDIELLSITDPIGAANRFEASSHEKLLRLTDSLKDDEAAAAKAEKACAAVARELQELISLSAECDSTIKRCLDDVDLNGSSPKERRPEILKRLMQWSGTLQKNFEEGEHKAVCKGAEKWLEMSQLYRIAERDATVYYEGLIEERLQLRGLLAVYKTRAGRYHVLEDTELCHIAEQAELYLYHPRKTPLPLARELVQLYADRLKKLTGARSPER